MVAGADSIEALDVLRRGGMDRALTDVRTPATLGQFVRSVRFGHVRQFDAVAARALVSLADEVPGLVDVQAETLHLRQWGQAAHPTRFVKTTKDTRTLDQAALDRANRLVGLKG